MPEYCPHCMAKLSTDEQFCSYCGKTFQTEMLTRQLPIGTKMRIIKKSNHAADVETEFQVPGGRKTQLSKSGTLMGDIADGSCYVFGKVLGSGGFGITYIAKELRSGKVFAIKEYCPTSCFQSTRTTDMNVRPSQNMVSVYEHGLKSFEREVTMLHAVNFCTYIVHIIGYFRANNTGYMVMEYLNGITLKSYIPQNRNCKPADIFRKFLPLMYDIHKIHKAGVVHRDIAPDNIFLMPDGRLKLIDFGCARSMEDGRSMTVTLKPGFAPVEQYTSHGQGSYTDVYALAASIYYCITGIIPMPSNERLLKVMNNQPDPLRSPISLGIDISENLNNLLMWALQVQTVDRIQTMGEFADLLHQEIGLQSTEKNVGLNQTDNDGGKKEYVSDSPPPPPPGSHTIDPRIYILAGLLCASILIIILLLTQK